LTVHAFVMLLKISISNKCCCFELCIDQIMSFPQKFKATVFNIDHIFFSWSCSAANQNDFWRIMWRWRL